MATYNAGFEANCLGYDLSTPLQDQYTTALSGAIGVVLCQTQFGVQARHRRRGNW